MPPSTTLTEETESVDESPSVSSGCPVLASVLLPPDELRRVRALRPKLLHAVVLPLLVGLALLGYDGQLSLDLMQRAWPVVALLTMAYLGGWVLSSGFERFPFIGRGETALASVGMTLFPAGLVFIGLPTSPVQILALTVTLGSIAWFLAYPLLQRYRRSRLLLLPGGATEEVLDAPGVSLGHDDDRSGPLDGIVAHLHSPLSGFKNVLADQGMKGLPIYHVSYIYELLTARVFLRDSCDISVNIQPPRLYPYVKRAMDLVLVLGSLPITGPLMLLAAVAIRLESPGPVLFWQERVGKGGESFQMAKFRSMYTGNEGEDTAVFADEEDNRVTTVGALLRTLRIDELPQFWNVLKGEMSLIGPRPEQVGLVDYFSEDMELYDHRHLVRPGITGWAQVHQGYADDRESTRRKLEYDLYYVKHQSVIVDLLIVYLTLKTILTGFGAR
jgi:lipopolysaccharide/colanic/teichoic acid biosynthesis glycosyltransferase